MTEHKFEVGQRVVYRGAWGIEEGRLTTITDVSTHKGRTAYGNDLGHWGYENQYEEWKPETDPRKMH